MGNTGLKGKLFMIMGVPLVVILLLAGNIFWDNYSIITSAQEVGGETEIAVKASDLVHSLQRERGLSAGFIATKGKLYVQELPLQRKETDEKIAIFEKAEAGLTGETYRVWVSAIDNFRAGLSKIRNGVSEKTLNGPQMAGYMGAYISSLISLVTQFSLENSDAEASILMSAYLQMIQAKEYAGQERAVLNGVFANKALSNAQFKKATSLNALQEASLSSFLKLAPSDVSSFYNSKLNDQYAVEVGRMRGLALQQFEKRELMISIAQEIGYGGMVHQFKNYVIRGADKHRVAAKNRAEKALGILDDLMKFPNLNGSEIGHISTIRGTIEKYRNNLNPVSGLVARGSSVKAIDRSVKISDGPALKSISAILGGDLGVKASHWFSQSTQRIDMMKKTEDMVADKIIQRLESAMGQAYVYFGIVAAVVLSALFISLFVGWRISDSTIKSLNYVIDNLAAASNQITGASTQVASSSQSLASGSSEQAASLEETSSTLEEMSSMTRQNADNTKQADLLASEAQGQSEKGKASMRRMVEAIQEIKMSSDETAKIVKSIDEVAFQTNLLALNAAVEAARAGDAGKGFAVVAEEVRNLAKRSADAAKSTSELIENSQVKSDNGVEVANEVQKVLDAVNDSISQVSGLLQEVTAASNEQAEGVNQVNHAVTQMDSITQSNAANAEQTASASEELSSQAQHLNEMMKQLVSIVGGASENGEVGLGSGPKRMSIATPAADSPNKRFEQTIKDEVSLKDKIKADQRKFSGNEGDFADSDFKDM